jgi:hypothetical protein
MSFFGLTDFPKQTHLDPLITQKGFKFARILEFKVNLHFLQIRTILLRIHCRTLFCFAHSASKHNENSAFMSE